MSKNKNKSKHKKQQSRITVTDYLKAVKKADREIGLQHQAGFQSVTKVHKNKKAYDRRNNKQITESEY